MGFGCGVGDIVAIPKVACKKLCKNLFVTSEMGSQKEKEILDVFNTKNEPTNIQVDYGDIVDQSQLLAVSRRFYLYQLIGIY